MVNIVVEVYLIYCCDSFCLEKILIDCLMEKVKNGNIVLYIDCMLDEVLGDDMGVIGVWLKLIKNNEIEELVVVGVFIVIGYSFNIVIFDG